MFLFVKRQEFAFHSSAEKERMHEKKNIEFLQRKIRDNFYRVRKIKSAQKGTQNLLVF